MAELAAGAVSSLLGVIRNEALLLRGVRDDVQFIKEEMESMKSFLAHLARWAPPGGDHDEQVRTWMNQVRLLAQDCNNCIDLYLYRRNPDIHRTRGGLRRYLWWVSWFLHKLVAQHRAAVHLRQLKDRARDVGERRLRYGVEVPAKSVAGQSSSARAAAPGGYAAGDDEEDGDDQLVVATATDHSGPRAFIRPRTLDDYVEAKLLEWYEVFPANAEESMSIVIMAPDTYCDGVLALAHETLVFPPGGFDDERDGYDRVVMVDVPAVHHYFLPLRAEEVLYYILRELELEHSKSQTQEQGTDQGEGEEEDLDSWQVYRRKCVIYEEKNRAIHKIKVNIEEMKIYEKLDKIKSDIRVRPQTLDQLLQLYLEQKKGLDQLDLDVLLQLLLQSAAAASQQDQVKNKDMHKLPAWDDNIIAKIAKKLEEHMEADEKAKKLKEQMGVEEKEETAKHMKEEEGEGGERAEGEGAGGEEEIAKHMEEEEGEEKTAKHMEEEEETAKHMDEEGGGGGEETVKHMEKKGEGAGEVKEEETAKHMEEEEEEGAGEGEEEEKEETTKHMEKEEGAREGGGGGGGEEKEETAKHMEEEEGGRGEGEEKEETAEHMKKEEGGGRGEKEKTAKHMEEEKGEGGGGGKEKAKHMEEEEGEGEEKKETSKYMEEEEGEGAREEGEEEEKEEKIAKHMEEKEGEGEKAEEEEVAKKQKTPIRLHETQYVHILREVFPKTSSSEPLRVQQQDRSLAKQATMATTTTLGEDQIKQMIHDAKQEILRELQEGKYENNQATGQPGVPGQNPEAVFEEIEQKMDKLKQEFKEQLKIKGLVDEIKHHLKDDCPLIILKVDEMMDVSRWEDIRNALSLLKCSADLLIVTTTKGTQQAKEYCYPRREPIDYSLAGLYHDTVLELTSQQKNEDNYNPQIFRDILEECEPHEFCMKIFTHALHANPKRSNEELLKLHSTLQALPKSFNIIANKMFKFSYNDLPKEYKSCLLYLAIFPPGHKIRRSTLIGRWVTEGLTFKEDWPSSVRQANRCFDALIHRWLVYPADIGATGEVKSCVVGDLVHGFITTIARKQHIVETRLSRHLARHFSIFNDLQLRSSDKIDKFFQRLSESPRVSLLKVLDLEGCQCFGRKNQRYLKDICSKMLLLKYLSLRGTNMTQLPNEINYLRELEVLDIRQTKVPAYATVNVLLLKLKRLLAGHIDTSPSNSDTVRSVQIPHRIGKMVNIEVLSNVKARNREDLKDIGKLWQLRKLGVVIDDKNSHLRDLLQTIGDLHECLRSLSITLSTARREGTPSSEELPADIGSHLPHHPKLLESLSISGTTLKVHLLPLFTNYGNNKLVKVTLSSTPLNQDDLNVLAKLPKLRSVRLRHITCTESMLTFKEDEFKYLKYLLVEDSNLTNITFEHRAARELEKMILSSTSVGSISGVDKLPILEEVELNNSGGRLLSSFDSAKQIAKLTLHGTSLEQDHLQILAKKPNMRCLVLKSCDVSQNQITLKKNEFPKLNLLIVDCSAITEIVFTSGSAPKLEKIVWSSFTSLCGIDNLPRLKELEFNGDHVPNEVKEAIKKHKNKPNLKHNAPDTQDQAKGDESARFSFLRKKQV